MMTRALKRFGDFDLFDDLFFGQTKSGLGRRTSSPDVDIIDDGKSITIVTDAPGYDPSSIDISVNEGRLTISGKRILEKNDEGKTFTMRERTEESFARAFTIDERLDSENIKATINNGVLRVEIPKTEQTKKTPIKIAVQKG